MRFEPFRMSIESVETTEDGIFFDGQVEQGILYEGDSIRLGRFMFPTRILKTIDSKDYSPDLILTLLHWGWDSQDYVVPPNRSHINPRSSVRFFLPFPNVPEHYLIHTATRIHYVNRRAFHFSIDDVFTIKYRGTCIAGRVLYGALKQGEHVKLINDTSPDIDTIAMSFEVFGRIDYIEIGYQVGIVLKDVSESDVKDKFFLTTEGLSE